ncbi:MAG: dienelactone hydrolase, partial [Anaerolineae bacterium]|nr:dienelactone hydrolase [Anaerolineae bacterium]
MLIRSLYSAAKVESVAAPFDTLHLKVFYPAVATGSETERMSGIMKADTSKGKMPVVIFFSGINLGAEAYGWLATDLAKRGIVTVLFNWVGETLPGVIGLTSGVDIKQVMPNTYGSGPTTPAIHAIYRTLKPVSYTHL